MLKPVNVCVCAKIIEENYKASLTSYLSIYKGTHEIHKEVKKTSFKIMGKRVWQNHYERFKQIFFNISIHA